MLEERLNRPIRLVNDLNAICVGEAQAGAGQGSEKCALRFCGTGVGMGAVVHGRVLEGADGLATELGHIKIARCKTGDSVAVANAVVWKPILPGGISRNYCG